LQLYPIPGQAIDDPWLGSGIEVTFLDWQPSAILGQLELVSVRRSGASISR